MTRNQKKMFEKMSKRRIMNLTIAYLHLAEASYRESDEWEIIHLRVEERRTICTFGQ